MDPIRFLALQPKGAKSEPPAPSEAELRAQAAESRLSQQVRQARQAQQVPATQAQHAQQASVAADQAPATFLVRTAKVSSGQLLLWWN